MLHGENMQHHHSKSDEWRQDKPLHDNQFIRLQSSCLWVHEVRTEERKSRPLNHRGNNTVMEVFSILVVKLVT